MSDSPESNSTPNVIKLGAHVVVTELGSEQEITFRIVTASEADVRGGKVSNISPLGEALLGKISGAQVDVKTPAGAKSYKVKFVF